MGINAKAWFYGASFHASATDYLRDECEADANAEICHHQSRQADGSCEDCDWTETEKAYRGIK